MLYVQLNLIFHIIKDEFLVVGESFLVVVVVMTFSSALKCHIKKFYGMFTVGGDVVLAQ